MRSIGWALVTAFLLAGCGGGGGSSASPTPAPTGAACTTGTTLTLVSPAPGQQNVSSSTILTLSIASSAPFGGGFGFAVTNATAGTVFGGQTLGGPPPANYTTTLASVLPAGYTWQVELTGQGCATTPIAGATFST
jgi:hypothetical protein